MITTAGGGRSPWSDDRGQMGGVEALPFGVLIFVIGTLLVVNAWAVVDARMATDAAAREATRAFVEAPVTDRSGTGAASAAAVTAGREALAAHGRDPSRARVELTGLSSPSGGGGSAAFERCARVTFTVTYEVPALTLPWIGGFGDGFDVASSHSELVDPFRDGVPGRADSCS
jgi:hypothetical protein